MPGPLNEEVGNRFGLPAARLTVALDKAREAFWDSLAASFPEVTHGDYGPGETVSFERATNEHGLLWLRYNHPNVDTLDDDDLPES